MCQAFCRSKSLLKKVNSRHITRNKPSSKIPSQKNPLDVNSSSFHPQNKLLKHDTLPVQFFLNLSSFCHSDLNQRSFSNTITRHFLLFARRKQTSCLAKTNLPCELFFKLIEQISRLFIIVVAVTYDSDPTSLQSILAGPDPLIGR